MSDGGKLIVGVDGLIGGSLFSALRKSGADVFGTSRRKGDLGANCRFLDLADEGGFDANVRPYSTVFLCAGITNIARCEAEVESTRQVNVVGTLGLAERLIESGARIIFLSSNAVFDGKCCRPDESASYCPVIEYGRQKVAVERGLMALSRGAGSVAVVRLSKTLSSNAGMAMEFLGALSTGSYFRAFDDLRMSPISLDYVTHALRAIAARRLSGVFHLSGAEEMTYAEFARRLANHVGAPVSLVQPCASVDAGMNLLFRPPNPALGMRRTRELLNIEPEPIEHLLTGLAGPKR